MKENHSYLKGMMSNFNNILKDGNPLEINTGKTHKRSIGEFAELIITILQWFAIIGCFSVIISVGTNTHYYKAMSAFGFLHFAAAITIRVMLSIFVDSWINNSPDILSSYRAFNNCVDT